MINDTVKIRIQSNGTSEIRDILGSIADKHGAIIYTWEHGQFGISNPVYSISWSNATEYIKELKTNNFIIGFTQ